MMQVSNIRWYYFAFGVLMALTAFYACFRLSESPPTWFDEGLYIQAAQSLMQHGTEAIQTAPGVFESAGHITGGYPFLAPIALSLNILGNSLFAARMPMAIFIVLCVFAAWLMMYKLHGSRAALLAMALLSTFPLLYGNGKNVLGEVPGMLYLLLALYFLWQIEQHEFKGTRWYVLAGLFVGLASATKPIFFLFLVAVGIVFLFNLCRVAWRWQDVLAGAVACIAPLVLWAYLQFGGTAGLSGVLYHYANPYAETSLLHTVLQNLLRFLKEVTPLYMAALMGAWLVAVGIRVYRKQRMFLSEWVAFTFSILILLAYLRTEGWYRYFFEAMVLALIFLPASLGTLAVEWERHAPKLKVLWLVPLVVVLLGAMQLYQLNFSSWVADHYNSTQTAILEEYFAAHPEEGDTASVLVYNAPELVLFLHGNNYYQYADIDPAGILAYGRDTLQSLVHAVPDIVLTTPSMFDLHKELFNVYVQGGSIGGYEVLVRR